MTDDELLDLYSDYLISAFGQTTGTGLAALLEDEVSHTCPVTAGAGDRIQRGLAKRERTAADLWRVVKPHVGQAESAEGGHCR